LTPSRSSGSAPTPAQRELVAAAFVARPNRFVAIAELTDGERVEAHLPDPGRLVELLRSGAALRLRPALQRDGRRTRFSVALVRAEAVPRVWVSVESIRANRLAADLLKRGRIRGIGKGWTVRQEVRRGRSRFDFLLQKQASRTLWVEVKSVTLVENGVARFPDAPTERGRRHLIELTEMVQSGERALLLFVVQRGDARRVTAHAAIDPRFARALIEARRAGVMLRAAGFRLDARGRATYLGPLPVLAGR
jgi:sugar fermentation stimulation protein A